MTEPAGHLRAPQCLGRRSLLLGGGAALVLPRQAAARRGASTLGLADTTVRKELARDYAGTLRAVAAMGYGWFGFRLASYVANDPSEPTPQDKARMVRDAGMTMGVVRLGVRGADYDRQLDQAAAIGARIVALTTAPIFIASRTLGQTMGEKAKAAGLTLAYHNHWYDLMPIDGDRPLDLMASRIAPDLLSFEIDLAWAWYAGVAPLDLLATLGPRVVSMHLKDIDRNHGTAITDHAVTPGSGEMDYAALMPRIARLTRATGYVEVDNPEDGLAAARAAMAYLRGR
ncbi:MAG: xylose isomerase [Sphingobium sp.]|nr:MAG: xylose isomerase [Sphingobium sp.]